MSDVAGRLAAALADRYRIERELGQGGMATVYLAEDLKHKRKVALKVLKPELAAVLGAERFVQEITTTAALQHPHILPLFDSGTADGFLFYVMPFIDGETLRGKLDRETQLGVDEAVKITTEVADALHYAHTQGVIHRDIKPENILLHNGRPMVADFGIALAVSAAAGGRMTETGLSLGTPHYMSPEQATAEKEISARSDVYSLASVLYEMLAGEPPHSGGSAQQIIMKIVTEEAPSLVKRRKAVPSNVAAAVAMALEKLPADRFESSAAFGRALADPSFRTEKAAGVGGAILGVDVGWKRAAAVLGLAVIGLGALAGWGVLRTDHGIRDVGLAPDAPMQMSGQFRNFAVSPDGAFVVYLARVGTTSQLWYRSLRGTEAWPIAGTEGAGGTPRLSPDGLRVAFMALGDFKVTLVGGGPVTTIGKVQDPQGGEWLAAGTLFFGDSDGRRLRWLDPAGGVVREADINYCIHPELIGQDRVLCGGGALKHAAVIYLDRLRDRLPFRPSARTAEGGTSLLLGSHFRIVDDRYLVYMSIDGTLMGTRIEHLDSLLVGRSVPLVPMVRRSAYSGVGQFDITADGTLAYVPGINADVGRLVRIGRDGRLEPLPVVEAAYLRYTPSPDGKRLATVAEGIQYQELTVHDLENGTEESYDRGGFVGAPVWSPDGRALAYMTIDDQGREDLRLRQLDSPGDPRVLTTNQPPYPGQVSGYLAADFLLVGTSSPEVGALRVDPTTVPTKVVGLGINSLFISIAPDRRWIAYQGVGIAGVYIQPWPSLDRRFLVDADGSEPRWASNNELVYLGMYAGAGIMAPGIMRVRIDPNASAPVGRRELVTRDPRFADTPGWSHALTAAGEVIYLQSPSENLGYYLRVIPGWVAQMKRAVDEANK